MLNILASVKAVLSRSHYTAMLNSASFSTMSFILSRSYSILSTILLYNKEAVSRTLYSLSVSASRVAVTEADTVLHSFEMVFPKNVSIFINDFKTSASIAIRTEKWVRRISFSNYCFADVTNFFGCHLKVPFLRYIDSLRKYLRYYCIFDVLTISAGT